MLHYTMQYYCTGGACILERRCVLCIALWHSQLQVQYDTKFTPKITAQRTQLRHLTQPSTAYTGPLRISPKARLQPHIHQCEGIQFARNTASDTVHMQFASPHALVGMPQGCPKYRSIVVTNSTQLLVPHPYLSCVKVTLRNSE